MFCISHNTNPVAFDYADDIVRLLAVVVYDDNHLCHTGSSRQDTAYRFCDCGGCPIGWDDNRDGWLIDVGISVIQILPFKVRWRGSYMKLRSRLYQAFRPVLPHVVRDMIDLRLVREAYATDTGWVLSRKLGLPVDAQGKPIPWYTYPAVRFLEECTPKDASVFEFGMGNSTLWWSEHAKTVLACEHDRIWFDRMSGMLPSNVQAILVPLQNNRYAYSARDSGQTFDIIVIDGRNRVDCAKNSIDCLTEEGAIVWDNSDRRRYDEGYSFLRKNGFKQLNFWGTGALVLNQWCTSVFYRPNNCLGI